MKSWFCWSHLNFCLRTKTLWGNIESTDINLLQIPISVRLEAQFPPFSSSPPLTALKILAIVFISEAEDFILILSHLHLTIFLIHFLYVVIFLTEMLSYAIIYVKSPWWYFVKGKNKAVVEVILRNTYFKLAALPHVTSKCRPFVAWEEGFSPALFTNPAFNLLLCPVVQNITNMMISNGLASAKRIGRSGSI